MTILKNATREPAIYYGLHMVPGVCFYPEHEDPNGKPLMVLLNETVTKRMDATFPGKPIYVGHISGEVDLAKMETEAAGYVVESFYNAADGKHWAKFIVVSDAGHEAVARKWKLSNAYKPLETTTGGSWHAVPYSKEILNATYKHLALVDDPRYEESMILTPEQFKVYNSEKESELLRLANSKPKEKKKMAFKLFKKAEVESDALEGAMITLKNGKEISLVDLIKNAEEKEEKGEKEEKKNAEPAAIEKPSGEAEPVAVMANGDHKVKVGDEEMTVNELVARHSAIKDCMNGAKQNESPAKEEGEKKNSISQADLDAAIQKVLKGTQHFNSLKDAPAKAAGEKKPVQTIMTSKDRVQRGRELF